MDPHLMAPHISLHGKWQQMNLSKPTENKGRQQQKGLQRHHWVCCLLGCILLLPRPLGKLQRAWGWGTGVPQCLQGEPLLPSGLPPTAPGTRQVKFVSTMCLALRLLSRVRAGKHLGWEGQQSLFHLVFPVLFIPLGRDLTEICLSKRNLEVNQF